MKFFFFVLILSIHFVNAQNNFQKIVGGAVNYDKWEVKVTDNHDYFVATTCRVDTNNVFQLIKLNNSGDTIFTKIYLDNGNKGEASMDLCFDQGCILSSIKRIPPNTTSDGCLIKTDSLGNVEWSKTYSRNGFGGIEDVKQTKDSGYVITGNHYELSTNNFGMFLVKLMPNGDTLWTKRYSNLNWRTSGIRVFQLADSGFIILAKKIVNVSYNYIQVLRTDKDGNLSWAKNFTDQNNLAIRNAKLLQNGELLIVGDDPANNGTIVFKMDSLGNVIWSKVYQVNINFTLFLYDICETSDSSYFFPAYSSDGTINSMTYSIVKMDYNGNILLNKYLNIDSLLWRVAFIQSTHENGAIILSGYNGNFTSMRTFVLKVDSLGNSACAIDTTYINSSPITLVEAPDTIITEHLGFTVSNNPQTITSVNFLSDFYCSSINSVDVIENSSINIFPNPFDNVLKLKNYPVNSEINIYDITGNLIYKIKSLGDEISLTLQISPGIYLCEIISNDMRNILRLIKQ